MIYEIYECLINGYGVTCFHTRSELSYLLKRGTILTQSCHTHSEEAPYSLRGGAILTQRLHTHSEAPYSLGCTPCSIPVITSSSFIHSGHFYSAPSSPLLLRGAPDYSTD